MIKIDMPSPFEDIKSIGEMTEDELLEEFEKAINNTNNMTEDFIILYMKLADEKFTKIKNKYPEYFL